MTKVVELNDKDLDQVQGGFLIEDWGLKIDDPESKQVIMIGEVGVSTKSTGKESFYEGWPMK